MATRGTKYRYGELVVDVENIKEISKTTRLFNCVVRGFGVRKDIPRKEYRIEAETNAKAARIAMENYNRKIE